MRSSAKPSPVAYPVKIAKPEEGNVAEVFSAVQGEGSLVGERHLFVRMGNCPFRCQYCDTPQALVPQEDCLVETSPGSRKFKKHRNPLSPEALSEIVAGFLSHGGLHRAIAVTGGEPLYQDGYLRKALPLLAALGPKVYLETAGVHVPELKSVLEHVGVVAMDIKLPSATGMKSMWTAHRDFLKVALVKQVIVKLVVTRKTITADLEQARDIVAEVDRTVPVILQPVTPAWKVKVAPTPGQLLMWQTLLSEKLSEVRIIPQCHRMLGDS